MKTEIVKIGIIIASILTFAFWQSCEHKGEIKRWEENARQTQSDLTLIQLELGEFKNVMDSKTDSILKASKIKPKWVKSVTEITNNYIDTTYNITNIKETGYRKWEWTDTVGCIDVIGDVILTDSIPEVAVKSKTFNNTSTFIEYRNRAKYSFPSKRFRLWDWRLFGRKESKLKEISECGEVKFHKVEVVK